MENNFAENEHFFNIIVIFTNFKYNYIKNILSKEEEDKNGIFICSFYDNLYNSHSFRNSNIYI